MKASSVVSSFFSAIISSILSSARLYRRYIAQSFRSQMQYKASFLMLSMGTFINSIVDYVAIWSLFGRFGALPGWTLAEVSMFYGMVSMAFALQECFIRGFDIFHYHVRTGEFDRLLLRPRSTAMQVLASEIQMMRMGRFLQGLVIVIWAAGNLPEPIAMSGWILMALAIIGGMLLFGGITVLQATMSFYTIESIELWNILTYGGVETAQYPMTLYKGFLKQFFMYIMPLAAVNYWPASVILGKNYVPAALAWASPLIGLGMFVAALQVWRIGERAYRSSGS